jgi:hypothetical protein
VTNVWFVVPAHQRVRVSRMCFPELAWACAQLRERGIDAHAVVVADDENLDAARENGLDALERPNAPLGHKWNDGFQHACRNGADYALAFGSDDWIDPALVAAMVERHRELGRASTVVCYRRTSTVSPDGSEITYLRVPYDGGDGVRLLPRDMLASVGYRPALDRRDRAIDGSIQMRLSAAGPLNFEYVESHPLQVVDFKSRQVQLTEYGKLVAAYGESRHRDVWRRLARIYPAERIAAAKSLYGGES